MLLLKPFRLLLGALAANVFAVFFVPQVFSPGIKTPIVDLAIPGDWQAHPDWVQSRNQPPIFPFYEKEQGTVLYIRGGEWPWRTEEFENMMKQMKHIEPKPTPHSGFAKFLANIWFQFPRGYLDEAPLGKEPKLPTDQVMPIDRPGMIPTRIWDFKGKGDAMWFYVSQLTPGLMEKKDFPQTRYIATEYAPMKLTLAERRQMKSGDFLLFEMETLDTSAKRAVERFQMPENLKGQRLRYGWVAYGAEGLTAGKPIINFVFATSISSGLDCNSLSNAIGQATQH